VNSNAVLVQETLFRNTGGLHHRRNQGEGSMNLFVTMAIISFLFLQASCGALASCESRNAWDREYNGGSVYQKCVNYRDKEQSRLYDRIFGS
jgi:hypothetical protein